MITILLKETIKDTVQFLVLHNLRKKFFRKFDKYKGCESYKWRQNSVVVNLCKVHVSLTKDYIDAFLVDSKYASECRGHVSRWT